LHYLQEYGYNVINLETKNVSQQIKEKIEKSDKFRRKLDRIANGQVILFIKHCKINVVRCVEDEMFESLES